MQTPERVAFRRWSDRRDEGAPGVRTGARRRANLGIALMLAALLAIGWTAYRSTAELITASRGVARAQEASTYLRGFVADLEGAESSQRAYIITGLPEHLSAYRAAVARARAELRTLVRVSGSDTSSRRQIMLLDSLALVRVALLDVALQAFREEGLAAAQAHIAAGAGTLVMDSVRATAIAAERGQQALLRARSEQAEATGTASQLATLGAALLASLLLVLAAMVVVRDARERRSHEGTLRMAVRAADAANEAKTQFLATVSHEIRTPLNAVIGMTELLRETPLTSEQAELSRTVQTNAEALLSLISDLLDSSKIEAGRVDLEHLPFDPRNVVDSVVEVLSVRAEAKGLELVSAVSSSVPPRVVGDSARVRQILMNLVGNAIKFTDRGEVAVLLEARELPGGGPHQRVELHIAARDTGVGIAEADRARVFERFVQADASAARRYTGTGLGLSISQALTELMGGRMELESAVGHGSTFHVFLPLQVDASSVQGTPTPREWSGVRALVAVSNDTARSALTTSLEALGLRVEAAESVSQAASLIAHEPGYGVAVIDDDLLHDEPTGALARLAAAEGAQVIVLCGLRSGGASRPASELHVECLFKPVTQRRLFDAIDHVLTPESERKEVSRESSPVPLLAQTGAKILLVEDNRDNRTLAARILVTAGYDVDIAENGVEAVERATRFRYELILMDIDMPVMDGLQASQEIRARERAFGGDRVPIVALTAHVVEGFRERALQSGMDDFTTKPITKQHLLAVVERWVDSRPVVLVADDSPEGQVLIRNYLRGREVRLVVAYNGRDAVNTFMRRRVSLILMDMDMPVLDGYAAAGAIRRLENGQTVPIIALTGYDGAEERQKCLNAGCSFYLAKPVRRAELLGVVDGLLAKVTRPRGTDRPASGGAETASDDVAPVGATSASHGLEDHARRSRIHALHALRLLDSPREAIFDHYTQMGARLVNAPVTLISLIDEERQFFKSDHGLGEPWASRRETPLSHSFCQHIARTGEPLVVDDAVTHSLVRNNPAVGELDVKAYAGMPISAPDGQVLGAFCAIDHHPRQWTDQELTTLRDVAAAVSQRIAERMASGSHGRDGDRGATAGPEADKPSMAVGAAADAGLSVITSGPIVVMIDADMADLAPQFLAGRRDDASRIGDLLAQDEFREIQRLGHNMKGAGEGYGFRDITVIGREIEEAAKNEDAARIAEWNGRLGAYVAAVIVHPAPEDDAS